MCSGQKLNDFDPLRGLPQAIETGSFQTKCDKPLPITLTRQGRPRSTRRRIMPTQLSQPRLRGPRCALNVLQRHRLMKALAVHASALPVLLALACPGRLDLGSRIRAVATALLLLNAMAGAQLLLSLPRDNSATLVRPRHPLDFGEAEFKDHFRFSRSDFFRLLTAFGLANVHDVHSARYIKVGTRMVRTDWSLMVLLKRLSASVTYKDLRFVVGGSKTAVCETFLHLLEHLYNVFCPRCGQLCLARPMHLPAR